MSEAFVSVDTKATGALFNVALDQRKQDGPIMTGSIEINQKRYNVSGFLRTAKGADAKTYLGLVISSPLPENHTEEDYGKQIRYHGKLFKQLDKRYDTSADYTGFIDILPCVGEEKHTDEEWENAPQLLVVGHARRNMADGGSRIALQLSPRTVAEGELNF